MKNLSSRVVAITILSACAALILCFGCGGVTSAKTSADAKAIIKTETDIMLTLGNRTNDYNDQNFPLIFPSEDINIKVYRDPETSLANFKTYNFDYTNKTNPLLEKELFGQLEKILQEQGFTRAEKNPQITISMYFFSGKKEQYTPPNQVISTEIKNVWNTGLWGWGYNQAVPITSSTTTPGYTTTTFYNNIRLNFLDHSKLVKGAKLETPPMLWLGEADTEGARSDIRSIAPLMFRELIKEFPSPSSAPAKRSVRLFRYGGLGLGFDEKDWRHITYVEPGSSAATSGLKPGDMLLKINNYTVGTFVPFSLWYIPNSDKYRERDAYYLHVLSNKGSEIDAVVRKADTGEKVNIKLMPNSQDRYIYVDANGYPLNK